MPAIGDLVPASSGKWTVTAPTHCEAGHPLGPEQVLVGHLAFLPCGGHTTWTCQERAELHLLQHVGTFRNEDSAWQEGSRDHCD
ncbi:MAG: hypothetical protein K0U84_18955 [Actinomycetia bacterium]|nr:hypothetical protein [Actinomycetes bacterium]